MQELGRRRAADAGEAGDGADWRALFDRWFDPCVDVAYRILHDADEAADVAQHTFLAALAARRGASGGPRRGAPFGTWALRATRDEALNRRSRRWRSPPPEQPPRAASGARDEAAEVASAAFAALGASDASALDLHLRHDFSVADVAEALGVSANEAHQLLFRLKRRLGAAVRAWAVWPDSGAGPACPDLRAAVEGSGVREFGSQAVQVVNQHARTCRDCQGRQRLGTAPEAMFAAVPVVPAGSLLRDRVVAALEGAGAPSGSSGGAHDSGGASFGSPSSPDGSAGAPSSPAPVPPVPPPPVPSTRPPADDPLPRRQPRDGTTPSDAGVRGPQGPPPPPPPPPADPSAPLPRRERPGASASPGAGTSDTDQPEPTAPVPAAHMARRADDAADDDTTVEPASHMARPAIDEPATIQPAGSGGLSRTGTTETVPHHDGDGGTSSTLELGVVPGDSPAPTGSNGRHRDGSSVGEAGGQSRHNGRSAGPGVPSAIGRGDDGGASGGHREGASGAAERPGRPIGESAGSPLADTATSQPRHTTAQNTGSPLADMATGQARHTTGQSAGSAVGGVAGRAGHASGERAAIRPYTYRRPRPDVRRVVGVALAVVMVLGVSLAVVAFTQGSSGSPTSGRQTSTSVPSGGGSTTTGSGGAVPSTGPSSTVVPTTVAPPAGGPGAGDDAGDAAGDQAGAPVIGRFAATEQGLGTPCGAAQRRITLAWESTGASSAQLDGPGAPTEALPPSGEATVCRDAGPPETYTLTVSGPGGTSFRTTTV